MTETRDEIAALAIGRSAVRRRILDLLLADPTARYHLRDVQRRAGTTPGTASRELGRLVEAGLAERIAEGSRVYFRAGRSPIVETMLRVASPGAAPPEPPTEGPDEGGDALGTDVARRLTQTLSEIYGARLVDVALSGSRARGDARADSDVNFVVILDEVGSYGEELERTSAAIAAASLEAGVPVSRLFISMAGRDATDAVGAADGVDTPDRLDGGPRE